MTNEKEIKASATLEKIRSVCDSASLSLEAKIAYVRTAGVYGIQGFFHPSNEFASGLYELARNGLILLEVIGNEYRVRVNVNQD